MKFLKQSDKMKKRARVLRKNSTLSEVLLWNRLKRKQLCGLDFDRQKVINNRYILDFYCRSLNLAIEIDGSSHDNKQEYDAIRDNYLTEIGLKVLHFDDLDVKTRIEDVVGAIERYAREKLAVC
jgi:very-short-patch-repair endonuclease